MKFKKYKFVLPIILTGILVVVPQVYAKTSIEIKPNASTIYTNKTISDFFDASLAMKNVGEGLEGTSVDVHMATNTEWAIFAYFSNSQYGTNGEGQDKGIDVTIGGETYKSTNGNITGMMNLGKTDTYTAGVISNYTDIVDSSETAEPYDFGKSIIENANNSKYVDLINTVSYKSMAVTGWYGTRKMLGGRVKIPYSMRRGLFDFWGGDGGEGHPEPTGGSFSNITFRPAIWN